jgi:ElaB/YqjD/DUF883 family membrane-anchored ribosome-binding protein
MFENCDIQEIEDLETSIYQLTRCSQIISGTGLNSTTLGILQAHNLLNGTSLETIALEDLRVNTLSSVAIEALKDQANEKAASWSAKIVAFFTNAAEKATSIFKTTLDKINTTFKVISEKSEQIFDSSVAYAKAHPYKTVLSVLAAAVLVLGVIKFAGTSAPGVGSTGAQMRSYTDKIRTMIKGIKLPFGKVSVGTVGEASIPTVSVETTSLVVASEKLSVLGWTKATLTSIMKQVDSLWNTFSTSMKPVWDNVIKPIDKVVSNVGFFPKVVGEKIKASTGTRAVPWLAEKMIAAVYYPILTKVFIGLWTLVKTIVLKAVELVSTTFTGLKNAKTESV